MRRASAIVSSRSASSGTTLLTMPSRPASSASMISAGEKRLRGLGGGGGGGGGPRPPRTRGKNRPPHRGGRGGAGGGGAPPPPAVIAGIADPREGGAEPRRLPCDAQVAGERETQPGARDRPIDGGNHHLRHRSQQQRQLMRTPQPLGPIL